MTERDLVSNSKTKQNPTKQKKVKQDLNTHNTVLPGEADQVSSRPLSCDFMYHPVGPVRKHGSPEAGKALDEA